MIIRDDEEMNQRIGEKLRQYYMRERDGFPHVSDLVYCLGKAYFRKLNPQPLTDEQVNLYFIGDSRHALIQSMGWTHTEMELVKDGIFGHVDIVDGNKLLEVKNTRKHIKTNADIPRTWIDQIKAYAYMARVREAWLVIFQLTTATRLTKHIIFDIEELEKFWEILKERKRILLKAIDTRNPTILIGPMFKNECNNCEHRDHCPLKYLRNKDGSFQQTLF